MANVAEASNDFWVHFKAKRASIEDSIHRSAQINKAELPGHFNEILQRINELEKQLTKATEYIPAYDARQYVLASTGTCITTASGNVITFSQCHDQLVRPSSLPTHAVDVALSGLDRCFVWLRDTPISALHIKNVTRSIIVCSKVEGSVLIYGLTHSILTTACHQFRMHDAHDVYILLGVTSKPIIEDSETIRIGSVPSRDPINYFDQVEDFNWLKKQASPNWRVMDEAEQARLDDMDPDDWQGVLDRLLPVEKLTT